MIANLHNLINDRSRKAEFMEERAKKVEESVEEVRRNVLSKSHFSEAAQKQFTGQSRPA